MRVTDRRDRRDHRRDPHRDPRESHARAARPPAPHRRRSGDLHPTAVASESGRTHPLSRRRNPSPDADRPLGVGLPPGVPYCSDHTPVGGVPDRRDEGDQCAALDRLAVVASVVDLGLRLTSGGQAPMTGAVAMSPRPPRDRRSRTTSATPDSGERNLAAPASRRARSATARRGQRLRRPPVEMAGHRGEGVERDRSGEARHGIGVRPPTPSITPSPTPWITPWSQKSPHPASRLLLGGSVGWVLALVRPAASRRAWRGHGGVARPRRIGSVGAVNEL